MQQNKVKHLLVVDENKTAGIITSSNLIKYLDGQLELDDVNAQLLFLKNQCNFQSGN